MNRSLAAVPALLGTALALLIGTPTAAAEIVETENFKLQTSDTPRLRLDQTNAGGFTAHTWDVAGNEANFFVRDLTGGSKLPFRIRPGAPTSSIDIAADGNVGIGIAPAAAPLHIARAGAVRVLYTDIGRAPWLSWATGIAPPGSSFTIGVDGSEPVFELLPYGRLTLAGPLVEAAGTGSVADRQGIDPAAILAKVEALPIQSWRHAGAAADERRLGPLAEDFAAAFGLGEDPSQISPADVAGVSLAAIQGLIARNRALESRLAQAEGSAQGLTARNSTLNKRVAALKPLRKRVGKLARQMKKMNKQIRALSRR